MNAANPNPLDLPPGMSIRTFADADQAAVSGLYETGLLAGQVAPTTSAPTSRT